MDDCMTVTILEPDRSDNYHSYTNGLCFLLREGKEHLKEKNNQFLKRRAHQGRQKKVTLNIFLRLIGGGGGVGESVFFFFPPSVFTFRCQI